jgi:hypothetical protein
LHIVTPSGRPIAGAEVDLARVDLGQTDANGDVVAAQLPGTYTSTSAPYPVTVIWLGVDISPAPVTIAASDTYVLTASNVGSLAVQVVGAQGQGLGSAQVEISNSAGTTVFNGVADGQGLVSIEVPYGTYSVSVNYKGFANSASLSVNSPSGTVQTITTGVFIEIFGQAMSFATLVILFIILILMIGITIFVIVRMRREKIPPPP